MTVETARRPGKRERTKVQNRATILAAAREVFTEIGFDAASVRDIVRRTDLATGTFYNYFPDKESVLRALVDEITRDLRGRLREARGSATSLEDFVGNAYRAYFGFMASDRLTFQLMHRNASTIRALIDEPVLAGAVQDLLEDLRRGMERLDLPHVDAEYLAAAMSGAGFEIAVLMVDREPADVEGAVRFATGLFLGGVERLGRGAAAG